jgi:2,4-dienoyl-CoA reductase-like NADH-dependent reductase (Old Yellow Enzyme family)
MESVSALFKPFAMGKLQLKNRVVMAPMTRNFSPDNIPGGNVVDYYRRRAEGDVGLIITEGTCIDHIAASGYPDVPYFYGEQRLAGWKKVVEAVHKAGGKIAPQLWHVGAIRKQGTPPEGDVPGYGPSGMAVPGKANRHIMGQQDIDDVVQAFAKGAADAQSIGCDAIEIHGAHGYLIDQFFWEGTNQRKDHYAGSIQNRSRFAVEIISAVRREVGADFPIIFRWSQWKGQDYDARLVQTPGELEQFLQPLCDAGVDIFHCSQRRFWEPEFEGSELNLAGWVGKITAKPTISVGSVGLSDEFVPRPGESAFREAEASNIDNLIARMDANEFELIAVGRALIANPDWVKKIATNRAADIKPFRKEDLKQLI